MQETLGSDFDLRAVRSSLSAERCWDLFSTHVDKLQRLEARLAEAVRKADRSRARSREQVTEVVHTLLGTLADEKRHAGRLLGTPADPARLLEGLDPRLLKSELVRLVEAQTRHEQGAPAAAKRARLEAGGHHGAAAGEGAASSGDGAAPAVGESKGDAGPSGASGLGEQWLIRLDELKLIKRVGVGSSGTTYEAGWRGASVAVKVAGHGVTKLAEFRAEVAALTQLRHPHVVQYMGAVVEPPTHCLVLEYCAGGDLRTALRSATPPGLALKACDGIASGMAYLHRRRIMHRDLKSANVLIDGGGVIKLTDFGVAIEMSEVHDAAVHGGIVHGGAALRDETGVVAVVVGGGGCGGASSSGGGDGGGGGGAGSHASLLREMTAETGTLRWMAPEVARHERYRKSADVYSFGMVCFELITHQVPFADRLPLQAAVATSLYGQRPTLPAETPPRLSVLIASCWHATPTERPAFDQVQVALDELRASLSEAERLWLDEPHGHPVYEGAGVVL